MDLKQTIRYNSYHSVPSPEELVGNILTLNKTLILDKYGCTRNDCQCNVLLLETGEVRSCSSACNFLAMMSSGRQKNHLSRASEQA